MTQLAARTFALAATLLLYLHAGASAAPKPAQPTAILEATRSGDTAAMKRLTGSRVAFSGELQRVWRATKAYTDYLLTTGPQLRAEGAAERFSVVVRLTPERRTGMPRVVRGSGVVTDFEPYAEAGRLRWIAVIRVISLED